MMAGINFINPKIFGLAYDCPKGGRRTEICPFTQLEHLGFADKVNWIKEAEEIKLKMVIECHENCCK